MQAARAGLVQGAWRLDTSAGTMRQTILLRALLLFPLLFSVGAQADCRVVQQDAVPLDPVDGHLLVTVEVNDTPERFILDTGAYRTLMAEGVVRRLGLERDGWVASIVRGIAGIEQRPDAHPRSLRLGTVTLRRRTLGGGSSVTVGPLATDGIAGQSVAGLLGRDFLAPFDLDIDVPARRLTLYDVRGCEAAFLPWTMPYAALPASMPADTALTVSVMLDGRPLRALVDTGAAASLVTAPGMARLGLTDAFLARDPGGNGAGIGPAPVPMRHHRFAALQIGPDTIPHPLLWVAPVRVTPVADLLLGGDWLASRHVWLSFATGQVFVAMARNG
jgi:hypothetical protein